LQLLNIFITFINAKTYIHRNTNTTVKKT